MFPNLTSVGQDGILMISRHVQEINGTPSLRGLIEEKKEISGCVRNYTKVTRGDAVDAVDIVDAVNTVDTVDAVNAVDKAVDTVN